jgi:hypothetical protein
MSNRAPEHQLRGHVVIAESSSLQPQRASSMRLSAGWLNISCRW